MVSLEQQEKVVFLNSQFQDNSELIQQVQDKLLQDIILLKLSAADLKDTEEYIADKVTIFRFLRECKFDAGEAQQRLLDTIRWRIEFGVSRLTVDDAVEFFDHEGFVFFHGTDNTASHPLIFVELRYFPKKFRESKSLTEHIRPFACLIMEMARKLTWDMTREKMSKDDPCPLVSRMTVLVNVSKAPLIPVDAELIKTMGVILDDRFPGFVNNINVLNFGWMYQGVWSLLKHLLSEEAKESIHFTSIKELMSVVSEDRILRDMGGTNDYVWSMETDAVLQKYGTGHHQEEEEEEVIAEPVQKAELPDTPPLTEEFMSRSNSLTSTDDDEFFDANDIPFAQSQYPPLIASVHTNNIIPEPPLMAKPSLTTTEPVLPGTSLHCTRSYYGNLSSWAGLRMGVNFLTSFVDTKGHRPPHKSTKGICELDTTIPSESTIVVQPPPSTSLQTANTIMSTRSSAPANMVTQQLRQIKVFLKHLLQISFGARKGVVYWIVLYVFLRGPMESLVRRALLRTSLVAPKRLTTTAIGITAAIAAIVSTGLSNTLERFKK